MPDKSLSQLDILPSAPESGDIIHIVRAGKDYQGDALDLVTYSKITTQISSAQFLAAGTTPIEILPAQGANTFINPVFAVLRNIGGGGAYVIADLAGIWHSTGTKALHEFDLAIAQSITEYVEQSDRKPQQKFVENDSLVFKVNGANPTVGTNEFELITWYTILDFS